MHATTETHVREYTKKCWHFSRKNDKMSNKNGNTGMRVPAGAPVPDPSPVGPQYSHRYLTFLSGRSLGHNEAARVLPPPPLAPWLSPRALAESNKLTTAPIQFMV